MQASSTHRLIVQAAISTLIGMCATVCMFSSAAAGPICAGVATATDPADSVVLSSQGQVCIYTYDATVTSNGQTSAAVQLGEPSAATFAYDARGRLTSDTGADATTTMYDAQGRIVSDTQNSHVTSYSYNSGSELTETVDPMFGTTTYAYDSMDRLISTSNGADTTSYMYNSAGYVTSTMDSNGHTTQYMYGVDNRVVEITELTGSVIDRTTSYMYDSAGSVISTSDSIDGTTQFSYDSSGQIISDTDPFGHVTTYSYDAAGNVVNEVDSGGTTDFVYTAAVPEPATWTTFLICFGMLGVMMCATRRRMARLAGVSSFRG